LKSEDFKAKTTNKTRKGYEMKEERWGRTRIILVRLCGLVWANPDITAASFPFLRGSLFNSVEILSLKDRLKELGVPTLTAAEIEAWISDLGFRRQIFRSFCAGGIGT